MTNLRFKGIHNKLLQAGQSFFREEGKIIHMVVGTVGFHFCVGWLYILAITHPRSYSRSFGLFQFKVYPKLSPFLVPRSLLRAELVVAWPEYMTITSLCFCPGWGYTFKGTNLYSLSLLSPHADLGRPSLGFPVHCTGH